MTVETFKNQDFYIDLVNNAKKYPVFVGRITFEDFEEYMTKFIDYNVNNLEQYKSHAGLLSDFNKFVNLSKKGVDYSNKVRIEKEKTVEELNDYMVTWKRDNHSKIEKWGGDYCHETDTVIKALDKFVKWNIEKKVKGVFTNTDSFIDKNIETWLMPFKPKGWR